MLSRFNKSRFKLITVGLQLSLESYVNFVQFFCELEYTAERMQHNHVLSHNHFAEKIFDLENFFAN